MKENIIFTPPLEDGCVDGTMRNYLQSQFNVVEKSITKKDLLVASEVFLTNSIKGVKWIERFEEKRYQSYKVARLVFNKLNF